MRVIIFDLFGNTLQKFSCSKHLEFPNGVVVNDREEIFISDNRAHCVKVFNYQGTSRRTVKLVTLVSVNLDSRHGLTVCVLIDHIWLCVTQSCLR